MHILRYVFTSRLKRLTVINYAMCTLSCWYWEARTWWVSSLYYVKKYFSVTTQSSVKLFHFNVFVTISCFRESYWFSLSFRVSIIRVFSFWNRIYLNSQRKITFFLWFQVGQKTAIFVNYNIAKFLLYSLYR